jgi:hypothetical protein
VEREAREKLQKKHGGGGDELNLSRSCATLLSRAPDDFLQHATSLFLCLDRHLSSRLWLRPHNSNRTALPCDLSPGHPELYESNFILNIFTTIHSSIRLPFSSLSSTCLLSERLSPPTKHSLQRNRGTLGTGLLLSNLCFFN